MKIFRYLIFLIVVLLFSCTSNEQKKKSKLATSLANIDVKKNSHDDYIDENLPENKAFGDIYFGMTKQEVSENKETHQLLGSYNYNFSYLFNNQSLLYSIIINSTPNKAIRFESTLKGKYYNLSKIISTKYGKAVKKTAYPSIFTVQENKMLWVEKWVVDNKRISLGIKSINLNSYIVTCRITHIEMEKEERKRILNKKNKKILDAAEKF